jgi:nitrogen fixation/metabolism regulation signal transduction histidine kinase
MLNTARRTAVQAGLRAAGLDFLQLYRHDPAGWRLVDEVLPEKVLAPDRLDLGREIDPALAAGTAIHSPRGALAAAETLEIAEDHRRWALVAGMRVPPDFFASIARVGEGVTFYHRFSVLRDVSRTYWWLLVAGMVLALTLVALLTATALARAMTRPLQNLEQALERVAAGNLETRVTPGGARELRTLGERFNAMTERLSQARTALAEAEREAAWREVAQRLAHEFKNLLTPMTLSLHRMKTRADRVPESDRAAVAESLAAFDQALTDLGRLAEQFSQYARLPEPRFETLDLGDVVRDATRGHAHQGVRVSVEPGRGALPISADRLLLSRAVHNLVLNACEASPVGSTVEVRTAANGRTAVVEILDRGRGLAPEVRGRLFEPYVSTKARGSGLGLSLVRDIATQHGGSVTLADREGGGARAILTLPLAGDGSGDARGDAGA